MGGSSGGGTTIAPYQETRKLDGTANINFQSITAMPAYENKSFEELRMEDYMAGNKGSQGQSQQPSTMGAGGGGFGMSFGAPAPSSGGFGFGATTSAPSTVGFGFGATSPTPAFGSPSSASSAFGAAAPAAAGGGLFGSTAPASSSGGLFGSANRAPAPSGGGLFGSMAPAPSGGLFGSTATTAPASSGGLFGSTPAPAMSGGFFGSTPAPAPSGGLFGSAPAPAQSGGLFGSAAPAPSLGGGGGLFGSTAPAAPAPSGGGLFGSTTSAPAPSGGLFGSTAPAPTPSGGFFGSTAPAPSSSGGLFGSSMPAPAPSGGLFGSSFGTTKPSTGGFFSSTPAPSLSGGLFGSTAPAPAPSGGLFGSTTPTAAPTFGAQTSTPVATPGATTILVPPSAETLLAQQMAAIENQNKELALLEAWRGGSRQSPKQTHGSVVPTSVFQRDAKSVRYRGLAGGLSPTGTMNGSSSSILSSYHAGPRSSAVIRPRGFKPANVSVGSASRSTKSMLSPSPLLGSATKQLVIKSDALTPKPKTRLILSDDEVSAKKTPGETETPRDLIKGRHLQNGDTPGNQSDGVLPFEDSRIANEKSNFLSPEASAQQTSSTPASKTQIDSSKKTQSVGTPIDEAYDFYRSVIGSSPETQNGLSSVKQHNNSIVPKLTKEGYVMTPSAESLSKMSEADLAAVPNFVVERIGFGSVAWEGAVDVRGIDLDSVVSIESKAVEVYHKEEEKGTKPAVGTKLNRPAILTLHNVYPKSGAGASELEKEQYERKIAKKTKEMGASFVLYDPDIGVWKLHVEHFSRYALDDDTDDDDDDAQSKNIHAAQSSLRADFDSGVRGGRTQVSWENTSGLTRFHTSDYEDECMHGDDENPLLSKDSKANAVEAAAEAAYAELCQFDQQMQYHGSYKEEQERYYQDENENSSYAVETDVFEPPARPLSSVNISAQIAGKCGVTRPTSSEIDFGLRMGKSFAVCWRPDGSFLRPVPTLKVDSFQSKNLVQSRPVVSNAMSPDHLKLLEVHLKHSSDVNEGSSFPLFKIANGRVAIDACADIANRMDRNVIGNCREIFESSHVFSLIAILFSDAKKEKSFHSIRQKEAAFQVWLRNVCCIDFDSNKLSENGDDYDAIFQALSGGDFKKASSQAQYAGHHMLSLLIANSNNISISFLSEQMRRWNSSGAINLFPPELIRIYSYLTNDLQIENTLYQNGSKISWERRLMMLLKTIDGQARSDNDCLLTLLIEQYERDVKNGLAPPANTRWCKSSDSKQSKYTSTLFRIMKIFFETEVGGEKTSLLNAVSPFGHSINTFDVSVSFHLSAILAPLEVCKEFSEDEETALLESYASQLQTIGAWEWAVYVCLCRFKISPFSQSVMELKKSMAIEVIRKNYLSNTDNLMQQKRSFLEQEVGIPSQWFEDALKLVAITKFDIKSFLAHGLLSSKKEALQVYEEAVLPDIVFNGVEEDMTEVYYVLNEMRDENSDVTSFRDVVFDFLTFRSNAFQLSTETKMSDITGNELLDAAQSIQQRLIRLQKKDPSSITLFPGLPIVRRSIVLKELMNSVSVVVGMIQDTMMGKRLECSHGVVSTLDSSKTAFSSRNDDLMFHQLDPRSFLRGIFKLNDPSTEIKSGPVYRPSSFL
jgi:nuclear pore complex protein Nup98-Nup96